MPAIHRTIDIFRGSSGTFPPASSEPVLMKGYRLPPSELRVLQFAMASVGCWQEKWISAKRKETKKTEQYDRD